MQPKNLSNSIVYNIANIVQYVFVTIAFYSNWLYNVLHINYDKVLQVGRKASDIIKLYSAFNLFYILCLFVIYSLGIDSFSDRCNRSIDISAN